MMPGACHGAEEMTTLVGVAWWWQDPFWIALSDIPNCGVFKPSEEAPDGKKNRKPCFVIKNIIVSIGAHALGKDMAYNADMTGLGLMAPTHSSLLIL